MNEAELKTPTPQKLFGETNLGSQGLEATEMLAHTLSQKKRKVKTGFGKKINIGDVNSGGDVNAGGDQVNSDVENMKSAATQREGKTIFKETSQPKEKTKRQLREEQARIAEIARI